MSGKGNNNTRCSGTLDVNLLQSQRITTPMLYQSSKKVPGGKLVRVKIMADEYIHDIQISGDFFLHPEEAIMRVEQNLRNLHKDTTEEEITARVEAALSKEKGAFIGLTNKDLTMTIIEALRGKAN